MKLTISMAAYDDYDGVFFTIQSLRMHHNLPADTEFVVIDNNPVGQNSETMKGFLKAVPNIKLIEEKGRKSSFVKYDAFKHATGDVILGLDCHILLQTGFIDALLSWWGANQGSPNLLTGPLVYNDLVSLSSHLDETWRGNDFGIWATNHEALKKGEPFEVPMQGMGCFSFWRDTAPHPNPEFRCFGAEEWYMAERTRINGGKVVCHPQMVWMHRFDWPPRTFPMALNDKIMNYYRGWLELYKDTSHPRMQEMTKHWLTLIPQDKLDELIKKAKLPPV
jgi:hypothetical protein